MHVIWYGQSSFKLQTNEKSILIDPYSPSRVGLKCPRINSDIIILTNPQDSKEITKKIDSSSFLIKNPGEYEIKGIFIYGIQLKEKVIYKIEFDDIHIGVLGETNNKLSNEQIERLDRIDILFIPIGGNNVFDADQAIKIIDQIEPKIIIPSCYQYGKMKSNFDSVKKFLAGMGATPTPTFLDKANFKNSDFLNEESKIILLKPR